MALRERQPVHRHFGEVIEDGDAIARRVVVHRPVGDFDDQTARLLDEEWEQVVRGDEVRIDGEPQNAQPVVEVELPDRRVPLRGAALEQLAAPDVVDEHVDVAVVAPDPVGEALDLHRVEVIDRYRDTGAAELRHEFGGFLDGLVAVVVGSMTRRRGCCGRCR